MKCTWFALLIAAVLLPNECPHEGQAQGCSLLLVLGHGSADLLSDPNVSDVDNQENILVRIKNDSGSYENLDRYKGPNDIFSGSHPTGGLKDGESTYFTVKD